MRVKAEGCARGYPPPARAHRRNLSSFRIGGSGGGRAAKPFIEVGFAVGGSDDGEFEEG